MQASVFHGLVLFGYRTHILLVLLNLLFVLSLYFLRCLFSSINQMFLPVPLNPHHSYRDTLKAWMNLGPSFVRFCSLKRAVNAEIYPCLYCRPLHSLIWKCNLSPFILENASLSTSHRTHSQNKLNIVWAGVTLTQKRTKMSQIFSGVWKATAKPTKAESV